MLTCTDCQTTWEAQRARKCADGGYRCKSCSHKQRLLKYNHSSKGKAAYKRYARTDKFKKTTIRYRATESGRAKHNATANRRYWRDPDYYRIKALGRMHGAEPDLLRQIRERDKVCQHCRIADNLTFDHIIPVSKGGKATLENLQILCNPCNAKKGNR